MLPSPDDTIAAIATAPDGPIGIVRVSGAEAEAVVRRVFLGLPVGARSHRLYLGRVVDPESGEAIDEALAVLMRGRRAYTGEPSAELQCHGGARNLGRVLDAVLRAGARAAEPGEFSLRAFRNGRLDLTQAEAVHAIIVAEDDARLRAAQAQLGGALRVPIARLRQQLLDLLTLVEASLDFAGEEHVYQTPVDEIRARIEAIVSELRRLVAGARAGADGGGAARVVVVGAPNVGKSSLFNRLLGRERAIVTDVAGTTRDVLEESTRVAGRLARLADTAGLHDTDDAVERIGIERTHEESRRAAVLLWVLDARALDAGLPAPPDAVVGALPEGRAIVVVNKVDLLDAGADADDGTDVLGAARAGAGGRQRDDVLDALRTALELSPTTPCVSVSARTGEGLAAVERALGEVLARTQDGGAGVAVNARHAAALDAGIGALERALEALGPLPLEMAGADLREAADGLAEITGAIATDEVLGRIFSSFCVGK